MIVIGLAGVVVPVLPGLLLVWGGVLLWALTVQTTVGWVALGVATAIAAAGSLIKYLVPGRKLRGSGVPWTTLAAAAVLALVGFFVVPVVGAVLGFVLGIYLSERARLRTHAAAWPSTLAALRAVGWSILIELVTALLIAVTWIGAVVIEA